MEKLNLDRKSLRKFGITMAVAFMAITIVILLRHRHSPLPTFLISTVFLTVAFAIPILLKPIYIFWMKLAFVLGWINTRLILLIIFYLIFTPIGLVIKLFKIDLLDRKIEKHKDSYWKQKESKPFMQSNYERQF